MHIFRLPIRHLVYCQSRTARRTLTSLLILFFGATILSCATGNKKTLAADVYYERGVNFMDKKQYQSALDQFNSIKTLHPLSPYVQSAELESIAAYYGLGDYDEAKYLAQRFSSFYPDAEQRDFAYFIAGRSEYARGSILLDRFDRRDLSGIKEAYASFSRLVSLFPRSQYVTESHAHMRHIRNILAEDEFKTAQFYFRRFSYIATINRCRNILQNFPGSPYNLQALELMAAAYRKLGWDDEADKVALVYQQNIDIR